MMVRNCSERLQPICDSWEKFGEIPMLSRNCDHVCSHTLCNHSGNHVKPDRPLSAECYGPARVKAPATLKMVRSGAFSSGLALLKPILFYWQRRANMNEDSSITNADSHASEEEIVDLSEEG